MICKDIYFICALTDASDTHICIYRQAFILMRDLIVYFCNVCLM